MAGSTRSAKGKATQEQRNYPILGYSCCFATNSAVPRSSHDSRYVLLRHLLIKARTESGLTQTQLARILKRPQSFVSKYETGERRIDAVELLDVCKALKQDPVKILRSVSKHQSE